MTEGKVISSRREFLKQSTGLGLGLAACTAIPATAASTPTAAHRRPERHDIMNLAELAVASLAAKGLDDIFPPSFEMQLLADDPGLRHDLAVLVTQWLAGTPVDAPGMAACSVPIPKYGTGEFRNCALTDCLGAACFLTLALVVANTTSRRAPPQSLSYRFVDGSVQLFDASFDSTNFHASVLAKLPEDGATWLVRTDIRDFYRSVSERTVRGTLAAHGIEPWCSDALVRLLSAWRDATGGGLPIGPAASHILAEAILGEVDHDLARLGVDHLRFADDYRMFAPDRSTALRWRDELADRLAAVGLAWRPDKTSIEAVTRADYQRTLGRSGLRQFLAPPQLAQRTPTKPSCPSGKCRPPRRAPDQADIERLQRLTPHLLFAELRAADDPDIVVFQAFIEASYWRRDFAWLEKAADLLDPTPAFIPYMVDLLLQEAAAIPPVIRRRVALRMAARLNNQNPLTDFELISLARLLGNQDYGDQSALLAYLRRAPNDMSAAAGRSLLEALGPAVSREDAAMLSGKSGFSSAWERRAMLRLQLPHAPARRVAEMLDAHGLRDDPVARSLIAAYQAKIA